MLPLTRLLEAEDMTLNQRFPLKNSGPSCTLKMKIALRVGQTHIVQFFMAPSLTSEPLGLLHAVFHGGGMKVEG